MISRLDRSRLRIAGPIVGVVLLLSSATAMKGIAALTHRCPSAQVAGGPDPGLQERPGDA